MTVSPESLASTTPVERKTLLTRIGDLRKEAEAKAAVAGLGVSLGILAPALLPTVITAFGGDGFILASLGVGIAAKTAAGFLLAQERMQQAGSINDEANRVELSYYDSLRRVSEWKERIQTRVEELKNAARDNLAFVGISSTAALLSAAVFAKSMLYLANPTPFGIDKVLALLQAAFFMVVTTDVAARAGSALVKRESDLALAGMLKEKLVKE